MVGVVVDGWLGWLVDRWLAWLGDGWLGDGWLGDDWLGDGRLVDGWSCAGVESEESRSSEFRWPGVAGAVVELCPLSRDLPLPLPLPLLRPPGGRAVLWARPTAVGLEESISFLQHQQ